MVLLPSRHVHVVPLGLYWESKDGWTPRICGDPSEKTRVGTKESKNKKGSMNENCMQQSATVRWLEIRGSALWCLLLFVTKHLSSRLIHLHLSSVLQMPQHTETTFSYNIDTISKQVIQPISCIWSGCSAIINSWLTLQKVCKLLSAFPNWAFAHS